MDGETRVSSALKSKFVTLPQEELILVQRKHWSIFVFPGLLISLLFILFLASSIVLYSLFPNLLLFLLTTMSLIFLATLTLVLKSVVDWYFNLYIVTNKRITEVVYRPLSARHVNEVLLDQVRCTEVDTRIEGIINEILDVGDVIITFDRPTHQEEFVFDSIPIPKKVESYLHKILNPVSDAAGANGAWYTKGSGSNGKWKYTERIRNQNLNMKGGETVWNL